MYEALIITPVKDSLTTTIETIRSIKNATGTFQYCIFNDFSTDETTAALKSLSIEFDFELINMAEIRHTISKLSFGITNGTTKSTRSWITSNNY